MESVDLGRALAQRHLRLSDPSASVAPSTDIEPVVVDRSRSLLNFAEVTGPGDWSLRSVLCRLAQPEPVRVGRLLESVRRLEGVLAQVQQALEQNAATCRRPGSADAYPDIRIADLARLAADGHDLAQVIAGYETEATIALSSEEKVALPVLAVAVEVERLAAVLIGWAAGGPGEPPVDEFDTACEKIEADLDRLRVPREAGPPPGGSRSRRS